MAKDMSSSPNAPLRTAREKAGVSPKEAAEALELESTNLVAIEAGRRSANVALLKKMCELYMITPNELLGWEEKPNG